MRKDRFVLAALAVVVTFVEVGHHLYEHHLLQRTVAAAPQQLRGSVDFGQGYGERAAASAIAAAAGVIADAAVTPAAAVPMVEKVDVAVSTMPMLSSKNGAK